MAKASPRTRAKDVEVLWTSLVESAFDFFERAVNEHDTAPKYATLHLATSVELFLKARLMGEHWTLIISPKKSPTFGQLKAGDFISVTPTEAVERLRGVLPPEESVSKDASAEFADLANERNKIAHFFHSGLDGEETPHSIIQRQCRVWLHLHRLLSSVWKSTFSRFDKRLGELDRKMREERKFLKTIFEDAKPELAKHRKDDLPVMKCAACEFESLALRDSDRYTSGQCLVCRYQNTLMRVECPSCENEVLLENGYDQCSECGHSFTPHEAGELVGGELPSDDTGHGSMSINCGECGTDEVYEIDGHYVCFNCMQEWSEIFICEWCNEYNTGDMEDSFLLGCSMCDGHAGHIRNKDD
jgi:uncharacterized Zn ribbon protein